jgi:hypothetical protein
MRELALDIVKAKSAGEFLDEFLLFSCIGAFFLGVAMAAASIVG